MTPTRAFRGSLLHCLRDPGVDADPLAMEYFEDGLLIVDDGCVAEAGPATELLARLPDTLTEVHVGNFNTVVSNAPAADLNIFGMDADLKFEFVETMATKTQSSCLFARDSGHESILA